MGNLLEKHEEQASIISEENAATGRISLIKTYSLIGGIILLAVSTSFSFMSGHPFAGTFFLVLFLALYVVEALILTGSKYALVSSVFSGLGLVMFLFAPPFKFFFIFTLTLIVFLFWAHYFGSREYNNMVKLDFFGAARRTGSLVIIGVAIFFSYILVANGNIFLQEKNVSRLVDIVIVPVAKPFVGNFSSNTKLDDVITSLAQKQLEEDIRYQRLTENNKKASIQATHDQLVIELQDKVSSSIILDLEASVSENVKNALVTVSSQIPDGQRVFWGGIMILFILVTALGFKFFVYYPVALIAFVTYELLIGSGFMEIKLETRTKEVVEIN
ncbi:MAG: hypothetical protein COT88_01180 [Candidatus Colwellbacteria bacterium CG10_big_fil_rev_8_21_14_0_10_41_28]|uniref:Uncharacterized protein n=1 Tax=Candidatus Colwellbacteria bacterium CG10_big_fil_rev_8_21_14_0_10_41_28 TaxID=1974539 RepID=A0A2H0VHE9_9BACT|nr:MAG: hypothetical protein COT88_01180 [Candidatus Colwellbacteria bacterium CG10_big_fil_rev_8_21_14_0_10_41_28]